MVYMLSAPAFATGTDAVDTATINLSNEVSLEVSLIYGDLERSDNIPFEIKQFNNGQLVEKVVRSEDGEYLMCTQYQNGNIEKEYTVKIADRVQKLPSKISSVPYSESRAAEYIIGYITFNPLVGQSTSERLRVYCTPLAITHDPYTVNALATDTFAMLSGIIAGILTSYYFPAAQLTDIIVSSIVSAFGGTVVGNVIGVAISETVSVESHHYEMRSYKLSAGTYSNTYHGVSRQVTTEYSKYYSQWFYTTPTPETWNAADNTFAIWCWYDLYGEYCPGVKSYS